MRLFQKLTAVLTALITAAPALAADGGAPDGWTLVRRDQFCAVAAPPARPKEFAVMAMRAGGRSLLFFAPGMPVKTGQSVPLTLRVDGGAPIARQALSDSVLVVQADPALLAAVADARVLTVTVEGKDYDFAAAGLGQATQAAARCAEAPPMRQRPIAAAPGWVLTDRVPGAPPGCAAELPSAAGDVLVMGARGDHGLLLGVMVKGMNAPRVRGTIQLAVDGSAPMSVSGMGHGSMMTTPLDDPALAARVRGARVLDWTLPDRAVHLETPGIAVAWDAVTACLKVTPD